MTTKNIGGADTAIRALLGSLLVVWAAVVADSQPFLALAAALVATVILATAIAGVCPLYTLLGVDTRSGTRTPPRARIRIEPTHQVR